MWEDESEIRSYGRNDGSSNFSIVACVFIAAVTLSANRFLATIGEYTD
jgi:hypothetical protein